jgi:Na+/H+ antiporter NhaD/arsenite permease-like protein
MKKTLTFFALIVATLLVLLGLRLVHVDFNPQQMASIVIFSTFIYGTLLFGDFRLAFAFGGIGILLGTNLITVQQFTDSANLKVIIFLVGMFLVIGYLEENQFFEGIVGGIVKIVGPRPDTLILVMMVLATVSAAVVDEVTSILFMTGTMLHLTTKYRLAPTPFVLMLVFATNIGSACSSIGNPIGVMIAFDAGFSFVEFLRWSAPIALCVNVVTYLICRWWFRDSFAQLRQAIAAEHEAKLARKARLARRSQPALVGAGVSGGNGGGGGSESWQAETAEEEEERYVPREEHKDPESDADRRQRYICWTVFIVTLVLLVTHGLSERLLGYLFSPDAKSLREGTMMVGTALLMGAVVLLLRGPQARQLVERRVDWWTLSFFMMLFASVGTLEHTKVTGVVAERLIAATGGNQTLLIQIVGWATGWLSAFLDNVLAVATFMPVIHDVRVAAAPASYPASIYWMMLFGGTFMGNMTVIGSTANIIALGVLEKRGHGTIAFGTWFKIGFIVSMASMIVASILLQLQSGIMPHLPPPGAPGGGH